MKNEFYIQDTRSYVGNSMLWWKEDNCGYVCDIRKAKVFGTREAEILCEHTDSFKMWPKDYIDTLIEHHIDMQDVDIKNCVVNEQTKADEIMVKRQKAKNKMNVSPRIPKGV